MFQFHEGPIKTNVRAVQAVAKMGSNSMKVRLKPDPKKSAYNGTKFQFHEGPIKTVQHLLTLSSSIAFQFHEGPIKTLVP